jgi:ParB family chromosome partitioning protein
MTVRTRVQNISLSQLVLSPSNVRKTAASAAEDVALEASIRAHGILQNLIVHPTPIDGKGVYEVVAGGRRLRILQKLAAEGVIDADHPVPCKVEKAQDAVETSLAENTVRAAMHPADEFVAMTALINNGASIEDVARRFGTSERHVRQRLRLGNLAPELLDAYRAGDINLDAVTAFTLGADHDRQLAVWNQIKDQSWVSPFTVKRLLTERAIALNSNLGRFIGAEAYQAAGGMIVTDLFSSDDDGFMDDTTRVHRLAIEKLEAKAEELRPQWKWTKAVLDLDYATLHEYTHLRPKPAEVPAGLAEELERIESRLTEFEDSDPDEWNADLAAEMEQLEARHAEIESIIDGLAVYSDKDRARAGCIVTIGEHGAFGLHQGLVERRPSKGKGNPADDETGDSVVSGDEDDDRPSRYPPNAEQAIRKECGFSQLLVDDLKAHRHQITRAHLAADFGVAFDLALYSLCTEIFNQRYHTTPLDLTATEACPRSTLNDLSGTPADKLLEAQRKALAIDWLDLEPAQAFAAMSALPSDAKQRLFAWCIAATLKPQLAIETLADPVIESAGWRLGIPFADYWRPTANNYWGRAKKAHGLAIGGEILGDRWAREHRDDKKPVLAAALEIAFDPEKSTACINLAHTARDHAAAWLPPGMAYSEAAAAADLDAAPGETANRSTIEAEDDGIDNDPLASTELPAFLTDDEPAGATP